MNGRFTKKWTDKEKNILKEFYPKYLKKKTARKNLMRKLPIRSWVAIQAYANKLGLSKKLEKGVLRRCNYCDLEAKNKDDLKFFAKDSRYKHNRKNLCSVCANKLTISLREQKPFHYLYMTKKSECKRRKILFDLDEFYLKELWKKQGGKCAISNIKMGFPYKKGDWDLVGSLDRINYDRGYTQKNVRWILNCINTFKGQKNDNFVLRISKAIINTWSEKND